LNAEAVAQLAGPWIIDDQRAPEIKQYGAQLRAQRLRSWY
jgi:hypothetical protein